ncbi:MAG: radical SAM family heme chaperone HemW [Bdellovibrionota bacterium]
MQKTLKNIYIHFPFCEAKCHYCDFFSLPEKQIPQDHRTRVYSAIERELLHYSPQINEALDTLFLGGGTPSLVPLPLLENCLEKLGLDLATEVTLEANPSSISRERASGWKKARVNRISMGVQALDDERLIWLGRVHSKQEVFKALEALFEAGLPRVSIDYIVGVPGQTREMISHELGELLSTFPQIDHVSAYLLTLKNSNHRFQSLPDEETQLDHLRAVSSFLMNEGFEQYEISNFAKPGSRARHNENYWLGGSYLGIGPSAHSFWSSDKRRSKNWASLGKYSELVEAGLAPIEWEEALTAEQEKIEYLMLRLRRSEGIDLKQFRDHFGEDLYLSRKAHIDRWVKDGLCQINDQSLRLTADGFFLSDQILSKIL